MKGAVYVLSHTTFYQPKEDGWKRWMDRKSGKDKWKDERKVRVGKMDGKNVESKAGFKGLTERKAGNDECKR